MHLLSTLIYIAALSSLAAADCCKATSRCSVWESLRGDDCPVSCDDGSGPTPCCGNGKCNAFCCNCDDGCHGGGHSVAADREQFPLRRAPAACAYDTTFDDVSGVGSDTISLSDYLVWAASYQPASVSNTSVMDTWIEYFHSFDANGDGKLELGEMHRPATSKMRFDL